LIAQQLATKVAGSEITGAAVTITFRHVEQISKCLLSSPSRGIRTTDPWSGGSVEEHLVVGPPLVPETSFLYAPRAGSLNRVPP
jgi:hypothetical protein